MLQKIRDKMLGWVALVIIGLVGITFVFWGVTDLRPVAEDTIAVVNGEQIPRREFDQIYNQQYSQYAQLFGAALPPEFASQLSAQVLQDLIQQRVLSQRVGEYNYHVPDVWVADSIRSITAFHMNGQFSLEMYRMMLASVGMTPDQFEREQRDGLAVDLFQSAIVGSSVYTSNEFRRYLELSREEREFAWAHFSQEEFLAQVPEPQDEEIRAYYDANPWAFIQPEEVDIEYVQLSLADVAATVDVDEAGLLEFYERTVLDAQGSEQRRARHILISLNGRTQEQARALAESLRARLDEGESFFALAQEYSEDPGSASAGGELGWAGRGIYVQPFEDALFALAEGEISPPVETSFGYHLIELQEIRLPDTDSFEDVREEVEEDYRYSLALGEFIDRANALFDASSRFGNDLEAIAEDAGLNVEFLEGFTRDGDAVFDNSAPVASVAFSRDLIDQGRVSSLIQTGPEQVVLLRVLQYRPEQPDEFENVADAIRELLRTEAAAALAAETAEQYLERLRAGASAEELFEEFGIELAETARYGRQASDVPAQLLTSVFSQLRGSADEVVYQRVPLSGGEYAVYALYDVIPGDPTGIDPFELDLERSYMEQQTSFQDFALYLRALERNAEVRMAQ